MRLLLGPAGSGKTASILDQLRLALRARSTAVRLLVPTATLAQHLQNQLAREGFVFPRKLIQTLNAFIAPIVPDVPQVSATARHLIVEAAARRLNLPEFARVVHMPGFSASLAHAINEFSSAGCDSARLAANFPDAPLSDAFLAVYREVDRDLARRNLAMRAKRLELAAERIADAGLPGLRTVWLDGFHALPDPELRVIAALGRHAEVTLTLNDSDATEELRARLERMGFSPERATRPRNRPALLVVKAAGIEREAEEIARRILEQAAAVRPFREMGIVVRAADAYVPLLGSTLERFGIPARFYFDSKLDQHSSIRFLTGALDAMLGGWEHAKTLAALRLAPGLADLNAMDRFDFAVRERIPGAGLDELRSLAGDSAQLLRVIDAFSTLDNWRALVLTPADWAERFESLRKLFPPARPHEPVDRELILAYRSQAAALGAFDQAIAETAAALTPQTSSDILVGQVANLRRIVNPPNAGSQQNPEAPSPSSQDASKIPLEDFWHSTKAALRVTLFRPRDGRRNAVQVIGAKEARQWSLPVVFVCGMVEKQFPQFHPQDPFFSDAARNRLNAAGIRVRTAAEFERDERALFQAAIDSASLLTTLTYPEFDARGNRSLPSMFLDSLHIPAVDSVPVRPKPRWRPSQQPTPRPRAAIAAPALLEYLRANTAKLTPSGLESFLQCPFQYFGNRILKLQKAPGRPADRLDFLLQGNIVHDVLALGYAHPETIESLFEDKFALKCEELRIPDGYHIERLRNAMRLDLLAFAANTEWRRAEFQSQFEEKFVFALDDTLKISGRIDRIDTAADGRVYVIDYKYSAKQATKDRLKDENLLQGPLYMMAAERALGVKPDGVFYVGLKGGAEYVGWTHSGILKSMPVPHDWLETAERRTLDAMRQIRAGRVEPAPANPSKCRFCDCRDICRVTVGMAAEMESAAEITEGV